MSGLHIHVDSLCSLQMQSSVVNRTHFQQSPRKHFVELFMEGKLDSMSVWHTYYSWTPVNYSGLSLYIEREITERPIPL